MFLFLFPFVSVVLSLRDAPKKYSDQTEMGSTRVVRGARPTGPLHSDGTANKHLFILSIKELFGFGTTSNLLYHFSTTRKIATKKQCLAYLHLTLQVSARPRPQCPIITVRTFLIQTSLALVTDTPEMEPVRIFSTRPLNFKIIAG